MIRAFIAVTTPIALHETLEEVRAVFQQLPVPFRWVKSSQLHLTLKFLGQVPEESLPAIAQAMQHAAAHLVPCTLTARALGCFPHPSRPRVLWMGLDDPQHALGQLHQRLESALTTRGFPAQEKPLRPHLTVARIRQPSPCRQLPPLLRTYQDRYFGEMPVDTVHLFQSQLHRTGAVHTILRSVALQR